VIDDIFGGRHPLKVRPISEVAPRVWAAMQSMDQRLTNQQAAAAVADEHGVELPAPGLHRAHWYQLLEERIDGDPLAVRAREVRESVERSRRVRKRRDSR
jgi:hypothetical protein